MSTPQQLFAAWNRRRLPQQNGRLYLPRLTRPASINRDQFGIVTIHAANRHDLFFAQGFVHAQDRLWQMELNRRAATGTLSAILGPATLDTDRLARTLGFARLAQHTLARLPAQPRADVDAYSAGVNAFLQTTPHLPLELTLLRHRPEPWRPIDSIAYGRLQMWALTHGAIGELIFAQLHDKLGPELAADLGMRYPDGNPVTLPDGIEVNLRALQSNAFAGKGRLDGAGRGSNGWVIAPARSATGHAILCNDMHLPVGTPSLWHLQHLRSDDGLHVAGFTQPGLPYVMVGHNAHIAWGATLAYTDCEDLFVEQMATDRPHQYRYRDDWLDAEMIVEQIEVRGRGTHEETVLVTRHGPLVDGTLVAADSWPTPSHWPNGTTPRLALSSMALRPDVDFHGFGLLNEARNWEDFQTAVSHIHSPALNLLYADGDGNIGHAVSGRVPVRAAGDGLLPAPGWSGTHEWIGEVSDNAMPHALNPQRGVIISANHKLVADDYAHYLGQTWRNGYRARRIEALLGRLGKITPDDCARIQRDTFSIPAHQLVTLLDGLTPDEPDAVLALDLLRGWNGRLDTDSVGGAVSQVLLMTLSHRVLGAKLERPFLHRLMGVGPHPIMAPVNEFQDRWVPTLLRILQQEHSNWLPAEPARTRLLQQSLADAVAELRRRLGPDPQQWQWGRLHQIRFAHALAERPPLDRIFNQGPHPIGGSTNTVQQTGTHPDLPYENNAISVSTRMIVDLSDVSQTRFIHPPGQSGHLGSRHYGDLTPLWLAGAFVSVDWAGSGETAVQQLQLIPQR